MSTEPSLYFKYVIRNDDGEPIAKFLHDCDRDIAFDALDDIYPDAELKKADE